MRHVYYGSRGRSFFSYLIVGLIGALLGSAILLWLLTGYPFDGGEGILIKLLQEDLKNNEEESPPQIIVKGPDIVSVVEKAGPAVVMITTTERRTIDFFFDTVVEQVQGLGSGVIFDERGYILTNNHVVAEAIAIAVVLPDGREFAGDDVQLVGRDPLTDLAVLKITGEDLPVAVLGDSDALSVGEVAVAIGNPYGLDHTVTSGIISALGRPLLMNEEYGIILRDLIQTDAPINPGNSGGPLLNDRAEVIGINTAIIGGAQSIGFALPINKAEDIAGEIMERGRVVRPWLGLVGVELTQEILREGKIPLTGGVGVKEVLPESPADKGGIQPGDIIIAMAGKTIGSIDDLKEVLKDINVGDEIHILLLRDGQEMETTVKVHEMPFSLMDALTKQ